MGDKLETARLVMAFDPYGNVERLTGPANAWKRAKILATATGERCVTSAAGINRLRDVLYALFAVEGNCLAVKSDNLARTIRAF